jgi:hypothetical protein
MQRAKPLTTQEFALVLLGAIVAILALAFYLGKAGNAGEALIRGALPLVAVCSYWIIGGTLSKQSYLKHSGWRKAWQLGVTSVLIIAVLFVGREMTGEYPRTQALFELGLYWMLSGAMITTEQLMYYSRTRP